MNVTMIVLRLFHFIFGMIWVGGSFSMTAFIGPSATAVGESAKEFMQQLTLRSRFAPLMLWAGMLSTFSGLWMYWNNFRGINISSGAGLALTIGGILGLIAFFYGYIAQKLNIDKIKVIVGNISSAGGPPKPEQLAEIATLQEIIATSGAINTIILVLALVFMSLSEYFSL